MRIEALGTSGGLGEGRRTTSLWLPDDRALLDAGTGAGELPPSAMEALRRVFLTHAHLDHCAALPFLAGAVAGRPGPPLVVHGLAESLATVGEKLFTGDIWPDFRRLPSPAKPALAFADLAPGDLLQLDACALVALPARHAIPAVGYAIVGPRRTAAFTGDTGPCPELMAALDALPRLEILVVETSFPNADAGRAATTGHYTPASLAEDLSRLRRRPELLLTHFKPGAEETLTAEAAAALSGWTWRPLAAGDALEL